jgi:hypothetical protein
VVLQGLLSVLPAGTGQKGFGFVVACIIISISSKVSYFFTGEDIVKLRACAVARISILVLSIVTSGF